MTIASSYCLPLSLYCSSKNMRKNPLLLSIQALLVGRMGTSYHFTTASCLSCLIIITPSIGTTTTNDTTLDNVRIHCTPDATTSVHAHGSPALRNPTSVTRCHFGNGRNTTSWHAAVTVSIRRAVNETHMSMQDCKENLDIAVECFTEDSAEEDKLDLESSIIDTFTDDSGPQIATATTPFSCVVFEHIWDTIGVRFYSESSCSDGPWSKTMSKDAYIMMLSVVHLLKKYSHILDGLKNRIEMTWYAGCRQHLCYNLLR